MRNNNNKYKTIKEILSIVYLSIHFFFGFPVVVSLGQLSFHKKDQSLIS